MNRFILSEEEKKEILSLHKKDISEQVANTDSTASNTSSTVSNTASTQTSTVVSPGVYNEKVLELQNLLKTKHAAGIAADGKLGPKTLGAVENVLQGKPATPKVSNQNNVSTSSTTPVSTSDSTTTQKTDTNPSNVEKLMSNPWSNPIEKKYPLPTGKIKTNSTFTPLNMSGNKPENSEVD